MVRELSIVTYRYTVKANSEDEARAKWVETEDYETEIDNIEPVDGFSIHEAKRDTVTVSGGHELFDDFKPETKQ
jgi:hypothetical protein